MCTVFFIIIVWEKNMGLPNTKKTICPRYWLYRAYVTEYFHLRPLKEQWFAWIALKSQKNWFAPNCNKVIFLHRKCEAAKNCDPCSQFEFSVCQWYKVKQHVRIFHSINQMIFLQECIYAISCGASLREIIRQSTRGIGRIFKSDIPNFHATIL